LTGDTGLVALLERQTPSEIEAFFAAQGFRLEVTTEPPTPPSADVRRRMSGIERNAWQTLERHPPKHWADLCRLDGTLVQRWYGSGMSPEEAIRRAAARWRVEQGV
jgi:hypothetical protein